MEGTQRADLPDEGWIRTDRVHRRVYTDPDIFEREMELIFEKNWVFVGHESEVAQTGDYKSTYIGRQPVIMSRHRDGKIYIFLNRCMHRGAQVCREEQGNSSSFQCIYHGWTYNNSGELIGIPYRKGYGDDFDPSMFDLLQVPRIASYRGFVFASLSRDVEKLEQHLGKTTDIIDRIVDASPEGEIEVRSGVQKYTYPGNWKFQIENWLDGYHPNFTHQTAFGIRERRTGIKGGSFEGSEARTVSFPNGHGLLDYTGNKKTDLSQAADRNPSYGLSLQNRLGEARAREVVQSDLQLFAFPNFYIQSHRQHFRVVRPIAVNKTEVYAYPFTIKGAPNELNVSKISTLGWWASAGGFGQPDDIEAFVRCQEGLQATQAEWLIFRRGLHREEIGPDGETIGDITDEVTQRGLYREWRRRMDGE